VSEQNTRFPQELFKSLVDPLIKFLNDHGHPHMRVIIDTTSAEVVEGISPYYTEEHVKD
jgi:hypothetical protein